MSPDIRVSFVVVNYFVADKVAIAIESIGRFCSVPFEAIVVDNSASADELARLHVLLDGKAKVVDPGRNGGFGAGCNAGAALARGEYFFFLNPDAQLVEDCVSPMLNALTLDPILGAVGCRIVDERGADKHAGGDFVGIRRSLTWAKQCVMTALRKLAGAAPDSRRKEELVTSSSGLRPIDYVTGAALMMRREDFRRLKGFDEEFFMFAEEVDLQYRLLRDLGMRAAIEHGAKLLHEGGGTFTSTNRRRLLMESGGLRFVRKHRSLGYLMAYKTCTVAAALTETVLGRLASRHSFRDNLNLILAIACG